MFESVTIFKPCTSKSGNSEVYVVNLNYKGFNLLDKVWKKICDVYQNDAKDFLLLSMFQLFDIPQEFLDEVGICANFFMQNQIKTILDNIYHFENKVPDRIQSKKWNVMKLFFQYHHINTISEENKLVPHVMIGKNWRIHPENINRNIIDIPRENFIKSASSDINLEMKFGKRIDFVVSSKFVPKDCLVLLQNGFNTTRGTPMLYQQVYRQLCKENIIINVKEFDLSLYYKFQYNLFVKVLKSLDAKKIILVNVPLLTHFLVGLLYILMHGFRNVIFWNGCIIIHTPDTAGLEKVKLALNEINLFYQKSNNQISKEFENDIIHLVSPKKFDEGIQNLVDLVWNYNCHLFAQKEMPNAKLHNRNNTQNIS